MMIAARFPNALLVLVVALAMAGQTYGQTDPAELFDDFIHYTLIAKPELAAANVRALLDSDLTDAELAALANADRKLVQRMTRAFTIAALIRDLAEPTQELAKRIEHGEAGPRTGQDGSNYRAEFVELVKRAASISTK